MDLTARQIIAREPNDLRGKKGIGFVPQAFENLCEYAKSHYNYSARREPGRSGADVLAMARTERPNVDCATLAEAFLIIVKEDLEVPENVTELSNVFATFGFATKATSRCFDGAVLGNMRTVRGQYRDTARCVFSSHYFAKVGNIYYDPCMLTTYASKDDVKSWTLRGAYGIYYNKMMTIQNDPSKFLIRIPHNLGTPSPKGFASSMLICDTRALDPEIYRTAFRAEKIHNQGVTWKPNDFLRGAGCGVYQEFN